MKMFYRVMVVLVGVLLSAQAVNANDGPGDPELLPGGWEEIEAPASFKWQGESWKPGCADGTPYKFYVRKLDQEQVRGKAPEKLLLYLEQGGACWSFNTCVGSLAGVPTYTPNIIVDPGGMTTGIFADDLDNPVQDYTHQVVLKYCSGDLHWGSADCLYSSEKEPICTPPGESPADLFPAIVHHRGYDNMMAVLHYLKKEYGKNGPDEMLIFGSSAGGYGARFAHAAVREKLWKKPRVKVTTLVDSAMGVVDDSLYEAALGGQDLTGVWGIERTAPEFLKPALASYPPILPILVDLSIGQQWPYDRTGSYTGAFDLIQVLYLYISRNEAFPELWINPFLIDPAALQGMALEWSARTRVILQATSLLGNNSFYLGSGSGHIVLVDPSDPRVPDSRNLYEEDSAAGILLTDWIADMIDHENDLGVWQNLSCVPFCLE